MSVLTWLPGLASSGNRDIFAESPRSGDFGGGRLDGRWPPYAKESLRRRAPMQSGGFRGRMSGRALLVESGVRRKSPRIP